MLKCDWNSTQFYITPVQFNYSAYNWEQIKFHLQDLHYNTSLNVQSAFSKSLPSSNYLKTLAEQLADKLSGIDPQRWFQNIISSVQFSSVTQSCPTLCDPMNRSAPSLPVHHQLPEFTQTHVHRVSDAIQPSHPLSSPSPPAPNLSQHQGLFQ